MSPSMLRVLLIALLVCTPVANAIKCYQNEKGKKETPKTAVDCNGDLDRCYEKTEDGKVTYSCGIDMHCELDGIKCCTTDSCNAPGAFVADPTTTTVAAPSTKAAPPTAAPTTAAPAGGDKKVDKPAASQLFFVALVVAFTAFLFK